MQANPLLGQNFLIDERIISKIIKHIPLGSQVLEIGPGLGALSLKITKLTHDFKMIEKDIRMVKYLSSKLNNKILFANCLDICLNSEIIISNLPYNISSLFLYKIIQETQYDTLIIMLQKELAEKIIKSSGVMGTLLNLHSEIKLITHVNKMCFRPVPSVDSIVLKMTYKRNLNKRFIKNIQNIFSHPNRKIKNNLTELEGLRANSISPNILEKILEIYYKT